MLDGFSITLLRLFKVYNVVKSNVVISRKKPYYDSHV